MSIDILKEEEFTDLFTAKKIVRKESVAKKKKPKEKKIELISMVADPKKKQQLEFLIPGWIRKGLTNKLILHGFWALEDDNMPDSIEAFCRVLPEDNEMDLLRQYDG
eukprot:UN32651